VCDTRERPPPPTVGVVCCVVQDVSSLDAAERSREFQSKGEWLGEQDFTEEQVGGADKAVGGGGVKMARGGRLTWQTGWWICARRMPFVFEGVGAWGGGGMA
jgi:hypothetical protein